MFKHFVFRGIMALVLIVALVAGVAGVGLLAYNAGVTRGLAASGKLTLPEAGTAPYAAPYLGGPFHRAGFWGPGLGLLNCLLLFVGLGFIFTLVRGLFWRRMFWHRGGRAWGGPGMPFGGPGAWEKGYPPIFEEWHRRAHGESAPAAPKPPEAGQA